jgi:transposase
VPEIVVPDNWKTAVTRACRYEPDLNRTYSEMAQHYHVAIIPARAGKLRDKAKVGGGVLLAERWIIAALRHQTFFDLFSLNQAIAELLNRLNRRPFKSVRAAAGIYFANSTAPPCNLFLPSPTVSASGRRYG